MIVSPIYRPPLPAMNCRTQSEFPAAEKPFPAMYYAKK
jgi:hypothetical protein